MSWLVNLVYLCLVVLASPWLLYGALAKGKYRQGWAQKLLGRVPQRSGEAPCAWFHAVSVGEVNLLPPIIRAFRAKHPHWQCVITTTTQTGFDLAQKKFPEHPVCFCPLDFSWSVKTALRRLRPSLIVLVELEIWPNLIRLAKQQGVKLAVVNGRLSQNSLGGYSRIAFLLRPLFAALDLVAVQDAAYAKGFRQLGAAASAVHVTGSIKFDGAETDRNNSKTRELARLSGYRAGDPIMLAGSTQEPEELLALDAFRQLADDFPRLRLILVPRHPQRFDNVAELLDRSGMAWTRRSMLKNGQPAERILLVDTIGELGAWWGLATIAYVGGSMGSRGGQNMIEPAAYGAAVSFGPQTRNFRDIVALLLEHDAAVVVHDGAELLEFARRCLAEPESAHALGQAAREVVASQLGATEKTIDLLAQLCRQSVAASPTTPRSHAA